MRTAILLLVSTVAGCATPPVSDHQAAPSSYLQAAPGTGSVSFMRDSASRASACSLVVLVDDVPSADLGVTERVVLHLPAGDHMLSVKERASAQCRGVNAPRTQAHVTAGAFSDFQVGVLDSGITLTPAQF